MKKALLLAAVLLLAGCGLISDPDISVVVCVKLPDARLAAQEPCTQALLDEHDADVCIGYFGEEVLVCQPPPEEWQPL